MTEAQRRTPSRRQPSRSSLIVLALAAVANVRRVEAGGVVEARPKSCLGTGTNVATGDRQLNFSRVYAQFDQGQQAVGQLAQGFDLTTRPVLRNNDGAILTGTGNVLRLVFVGNTTSQAQGYSNDTDFLSTIVTDTNVLTFPVNSNTSALCSSIRTTSGPQGTTENGQLVITDSGCPYQGDIALGVAVPLSNSYALTTISTELVVLDPSNDALHLACYDVSVTPFYPSHWVYKLILYFIIGLLSVYTLLYVIAHFWAAYTTWLHDNETHLASSLTLKLVTTSTPLSRRKMWGAIWFGAWAGKQVVNSGSLRRFVTAELRELYAFAMWFSLVGAVAVNWPGFAYPGFAKAAWTTLVYNNSLPFTSSPPAVLPDAFEVPQDFSSQINDITSPLYLDDELPNVLLDLDSSRAGIERWSRMIGVRYQDIWSVCAFTFFCIVAAVVAAHILFFTFDSALDKLFPSRFSKNRLRQQAKESSTGQAMTELKQHAHNRSTSTKAKDGRSSSLSQPRPSESSMHAFMDGGEYGDEAFLQDSGDNYGPSRPEDMIPSWRLHLALLQGNLTRVLVLFHLPLVTFSVYQFSIREISPTSTFALAIVTFAVVCIAIPAAILWRMHRVPARDLYGSMVLLLSFGPLYNTMSDECVMFSGVRMSANLVVGIMIGAAQKVGTAQAAVILIVEVADTLITSLWLPWGDNASMGPLAFIMCLARIIIAVLLVVLSPSVNVSSSASAWIAYIVLLVHGVVWLMFLFILMSKFFELVIRFFGTIPFDESRSPRAGGLGGALRKLDRSAAGRSTGGGQNQLGNTRKKGKASRRAAAAAVANASRQSSDFSTHANVGQRGWDNHGQAYAPSETTVGTRTRLLDRPGHQTPQPSFTHSDGSRSFYGGATEDDAYIMSAMSSGPWVATQGSGHVKPGEYSSTTSSTSGPVIRSGPHRGDQVTVVPAVSSTGFARISGGRASSTNPYQLVDASGAGDSPNVPAHFSRPSHEAYTGASARPPGNPRRLSQSAVIEMATGPNTENTSSSNVNPSFPTVTRHQSRPSLSHPPSSSALFSNTVTPSYPPSRPGLPGSSNGSHQGRPSHPTKNKGFFGRFRKAKQPTSDVSSDEDTDDEDDDGDQKRGRRSKWSPLRLVGIGQGKRRRHDEEEDDDPYGIFEEQTPPAQREFVVQRKPRPGPPRQQQTEAPPQMTVQAPSPPASPPSSR
ncbi:hypothetical protein OIO90_000856 [Microbotryomycetes sp. JL221]|nr:hypothetical protein OIO90_000856 [Microbotryomycetes sp. JL221]